MMDVLERIEKGEYVVVKQAHDGLILEDPEAIRELLELAKLGKWMQRMSVSKGLPEPRKPVVVKTIHNGYQIASLWQDKSTWEVIGIDNKSNLLGLFAIVEWMPLPPNPGEGE